MKAVKIFKYAILLICIPFFIGCNSDDDTVAEIPSVAYNNTTINAVFFQEGVVAPTVNWNGNQGSFYLANTIEGISIDPNTGVISWSKILAPKTHTVQVIATNSGGQTVIDLTIHNPLQGIFTDDYSPTLTVEFEFYTDLSMLFRTIDTSSSFITATDTTSGTYTISNNIILVDLESTILSGPLTQSTSIATYTPDLIYSGAVTASFEAIMN